MKGSLVFNLPEESAEFDAAVRGAEYREKIDAIWNQIFRPRNKHGYNSKIINALLGMDTGDVTSEQVACNALMDELEKIYQAIAYSES